MGFDINVSISAFTVLLQGLLSFFSPCVLPLIPLYVAYLSGGTMKQSEDGSYRYDQKRVFLNTIFFVVGISFAFFLLGFGVSTLSSFFIEYKVWFARIGGLLIFVIGLYQLGVFGTSEVLSKEKRLPLRLDKLTMSPVTALLMGFTFSFAWTPCVGPALTSVLLMTASTANRASGFLLIGLYTLGFIVPFLLVGVFTTKLLDLFKKHRNVVKYTVKVGAVLMLIIGALMFTGQMNSISGILSTVGTDTYLQDNAADTDTEHASARDDDTVSEDVIDDSDEDRETETRAIIEAHDFTLTDQYGNEHTLSDYRGKVVFLNFWATWCPPCRAEMPEIEKIYQQHQLTGELDVVILGIACPGYGSEGSVEDITAFLEENNYTYPVLMDTNQAQFSAYGITALPTTFMIDRDGNIYGYVSGQLSEEVMLNIINMTLESVD